MYECVYKYLCTYIFVLHHEIVTSHAPSVHGSHAANPSVARSRHPHGFGSVPHASRARHGLLVHVLIFTGLALIIYIAHAHVDLVTCCIDQCMTRACYGRVRPHVTRLSGMITLRTSYTLGSYPCDCQQLHFDKKPCLIQALQASFDTSTCQLLRPPGQVGDTSCRGMLHASVHACISRALSWSLSLSFVVADPGLVPHSCSSTLTSPYTNIGSNRISIRICSCCYQL